MITATIWVPRGFAAQFPERQVFDEGEYDRIADLAQLQLEDAKEDLKDAADPDDDLQENGESMEVEDQAEESHSKTDAETKPLKEADKNDLAEYNLDDYDDDVDEEGERSSLPLLDSIKNLAYHNSNTEDPYITMKETDEDDEREELQILATDNLLLAARMSEDDVPSLDIYVYEDEVDNLYVHHDLVLPAIPLCIEWLDLPVNQEKPPQDTDQGNFVAIGSMDPDIEIWDLDTVDPLYPNAILGAGANVKEKGGKSSKKNKKKKKHKSKANDSYHVDSVLALSANRNHRNLLASGSADKTIKLWDLKTCQCAKSYTQHTDKVCSLSWHPKESTILLSGSYDRTAVATDMRSPDAKPPRWGVESDIESVRWDPHDPNYFYICTESGMVHLHDARNAPSSAESARPVWTLQAHDTAVNSFDINPVIPGFLVTGGMDKQVKLWNVPTGGGGPTMVVARDLGVGKIFSTNFAPDREVGFRLAVAGSKGIVQVWDTSTNAATRRTFATRVGLSEAEAANVVKEKLITVQDSGDEESDEDEGGARVGGEEQDGWESVEEKQQ